MSRFPLIWLGIVASLFLIEIAHAQTVRHLNLPAGVEIGEAIARQPPSELAGERFLKRLSKIRSHHRPIPIGRSTVPFSTETTTNPVAIKARQRQADFGEGVFVVRRQTVTESAGMDYGYASPISEPTVAARGREILITGNWYAAFSRDDGETFALLDPYSLFVEGKPHDSTEFCCDQVAIYDRQTDTVFWLLQGDRDKDGNSFRLLVAHGEKDISENNWRFYDIPISLIEPNGGV